MSDLLTDEEINEIHDGVIEEQGYSDSDLIEPRIAKAQNAKTKKGLVEWLNKAKLGEFRIVNRQFVDGEPNCVIFTQVYWESVKKEVEDG